jgi:hypothetical protein
MEPSPLWIPFLAIPLGIGAIVTLIVTLHRAKIRELDQRHRERMAAIEKGFDPGAFGVSGRPETPPDVPTASSWGAARPPRQYLLRGLIWLGVGLAFVFSSGGGWPSLPGWVAAAVGGAYVVYYLLEGRSPPPPPPAERPPGGDQAH